MKTRLTFYTEAPAFSGGEQVLVMLLNGLPREAFALSCVATSSATLETIEHRLLHQDVELVLFDQGDRPSILRTVWPLSRVIASLQPDIVHCNSIDVYAVPIDLCWGDLSRISALMALGKSPMHPLREQHITQILDCLETIAENYLAVR